MISMDCYWVDIYFLTILISLRNILICNYSYHFYDDGNMLSRFYAESGFNPLPRILFLLHRADPGHVQLPPFA